MTGSTWSVPETEVVQSIRDSLDDRAAGATDPPDVLATVVGVEGNAYRRPGAKMLLSPDGEGVGAITAGCLEEDLASVAERIRETGTPEVVTYDLMDDDEDIWGLGVGCNGVIDVLLEPLTETYRPAVDAFAEGHDVAVATVLDGGDGPLARGDRAYYRPDDGTLRTPAGDPATDWPAGLTGAAGDLAGRGRGDTLVFDDGETTVEVFVDGIAAPTDLVVFGTGHDVGPVTELAARNDFRVTVVGFRGAVDPAERFPEADRTVTTSPGRLEEADGLRLDDRTHAVVMTHNFVDDRIVVETLLDAGVAYVGLMGPRERFEEMLEAFADEGRRFTEAELDPLYTPVGLDLGGGSPYQIAHSIVAEVLAVANDREPRHLKTREGPIHERVDLDAGDGDGGAAGGSPDAPTQ